MEKLISAIQQLIINTPNNVPIAKDSEFIRDMENLLRQVNQIADKYHFPKV